MTTLVLCMYAMIVGFYIGEQRADKRHSKAVLAHDTILANARKAFQTAAFVGTGPVVSNVSEWALGDKRFRLTIEPVGGDEKEPSEPIKPSDR